MTEKTSKEPNISNLVLRPIANGWLVEVETESEDITHAFKTFRQVQKYFRSLENLPKPELED